MNSLAQEQELTQAASVGPWSNTRLYLCGDGGFELVRSAKHVWRKGAAAGQGPRVRGTGRGAPSSAEDRAARDLENRGRSLRRSTGAVRRLVKVNGLQWMWTLTFGECVQEVQEADRAFWRFSRWLKSRGVRWLAVREFQKRGAVHYHLVVDRFLAHGAVARAWGEGWVWVQGPQSGWKVNQVSRYLTKYLTKDCADVRLQGHHRYLRPLGLSLWVAEDMWTRTPEDVRGVIYALAGAYGWEVHYLRESEEFICGGGGP